MTNATLWEKGLWPLGHSSSLLSALGLCTAASQSERTTQSAAKHRKLRKYKTMRTLLLLVSGAAGLQLHKNIKLAAPALPVVLLPSVSVAAADSYEYGSA